MMSFFSDQYYLDASRRQTLHTPIIGIPPTNSAHPNHRHPADKLCTPNHRHPADRFFQALSSQCKDSHKKPYRQKTAPYNLQKSVNKPSFRVKKTNCVIYNT